MKFFIWSHFFKNVHVSSITSLFCELHGTFPLLTVAALNLTYDDDEPFIFLYGSLTFDLFTHKLLLLSDMAEMGPRNYFLSGASLRPYNLVR